MSKHDRDENEHKKLREELKKNKKEDQILRRNILEEFRADRVLVQSKCAVISTPTNHNDSSSSTSTKVPDDSTTIQIRLIDGSRLRVILRNDDTLSKLWNEIEGRTEIRREEFILIQPFPRKVFEEDTFDSSLFSFGLSPNANLAFEKRKTSQQAQHFVLESSHNEENVDEDASMDDDDNDVEEEHHDEQEEEDDDDDDEVIGQLAAPRFPDNMHGWGPGYNMLEINYGLPNLSHQSRNANEMMAEAASRRLNRLQQQQQQQLQLAQTPTNTPPTDPITSFQPKAPHTLKDISMFGLLNTVLAERPPYNIGDLPASLAEECISILVRQGELKPHHLRHFVRCHLHRINLDNFKNCSNEILHSLKKHGNLQHISLRNLQLITNNGINHLNCLRNLCSLNLGGCNLITDGVMPSISELANLEELVLDRTSITDQGIKILCESRPPKLTSLDLCTTNITQNALTCLHMISTLRVLSLQDCPLLSIEGLEKVTTLTDLNLSGTFITTEAISRLQTLNQLRSLKLSNTSEISSNRALMMLGDLKLKKFALPNRSTLTDKGISYLSNMPLISLDLSHYSYVTDEGMQHVGRIKTLKKLFLTDTKITDRGLMFLTDLKDLSELSLVRCQVTDAGAVLFKSLQRLSTLNLSMTGITNEMITKDHLSNCKYLRTLNLSKTHVTSEGIEQLRVQSLLFLNIDQTGVDPISPPVIPGCPNLKQVLCKTKASVPPETL